MDRARRGEGKNPPDASIHERQAEREQKVIVTSWIFPNGKWDEDRTYDILKALNFDKSKLVIDLSCRKQGDKWIVTTDKWQTLTDIELEKCISYHSKTKRISLLTQSYRVF